MNASSKINSSSTGSSSLWLGLGLAAFGIGAYVAQIQMALLKAPWYLPVVTTIGAILIAAALWQRRSVWRIVALMLLVLLAGGAWAFMFFFRYPEYAGPAKVDQPIPAFTTFNADGKPFSEGDLKGDKNTVMVFFRGRW